jgi:hypothetical protein
MTEREIEAVLREVTDEEVAFYQEYGWVMMKQLVAPEFAEELLRQPVHSGRSLDGGYSAHHRGGPRRMV